MEATLDAVTQIPAPRNEPVHSYAPGSPERVALEGRLKELAAEPAETPAAPSMRSDMSGCSSNQLRVSSPWA